jgi:hypothetical protein
MSKKGAFDLSLGFIIGLIFAVILLTLAIMWIRGAFTGIGTMTNDLTQKASDTLSETFKTGTNNFDVYPGEYTLAPGTGVKLQAGIQNNAEDGAVHKFTIKITPSSASKSIVTAECGEGSSFNACTGLHERMLSWLTYPEEIQYSIQPNTFKTWDIVITIPNDAVKGQYLFDIVACKDMADAAGCDSITANWGSGAVPLTIMVES